MRFALANFGMSIATQFELTQAKMMTMTWKANSLVSQLMVVPLFDLLRQHQDVLTIIAIFWGTVMAIDPLSHFAKTPSNSSLLHSMSKK